MKAEKERQHVPHHTLLIRWGTSRGRNTYGYTTCSLSEHGKRLAACNGGGYDMRGTVFGTWLAAAYRDRLLQLKPEDMPEHSHWQSNDRAFICYPCTNMRAVLNNDENTPTAPVAVRTAQPLHSDGFEWPKCPECGEDMNRDTHAGTRIEDGRYLYGLSFHDPDYDPSKAVIGEGCDDRTLGAGATGKTVAEAEAAGESFGLERYQAFYRASSKVPTARHRVPSIDGACGFESVRRIAEAIGLEVRMISAGSKTDVIEVYEAKP